MRNPAGGEKYGRGSPKRKKGRDLHAPFSDLGPGICFTR